MSRLPVEPSLPASVDGNLIFQLKTLLRQTFAKVNGIADGAISAIDNAATAAPTSGTWKQGDFIRNSTPSELGTAGSKYLVTGWYCTSSGTPGTWLQARSLTGN